MLIRRQASKELRELARQYPVVVVVGPRQSGKTTLCRATFPKLPYISLEDPDQRRFATEDPRGLLEQYATGALLDEVQRAPELLSYLQGVVDADPAPGRFVLTGSQQLDVMAGVTQTLAGRAATSGWLVHGGDQQQQRRGLVALPWQTIARLPRAGA